MIRYPFCMKTTESDLSSSFIAGAASCANRKLIIGNFGSSDGSNDVDDLRSNRDDSSAIYFLQDRSLSQGSLDSIATTPTTDINKQDFGGNKTSMLENGHVLSCSDDDISRKCSLPATLPKPIPSFLHACEQCDEEVVRYYIVSGVTPEDLNAQDKTGKTGLCHACANGFVTIVSLLRLPTINVNLADNEGNTPLIFASQAGHGDIVSLLLNYFPGIEIDKANNHGFTALMKAAIQGRARCAKLLLYAGASLYKRDHGRGLCALEWAEYCNRQTCAKTIAQFVEACNLGIICSNLLATSRNCLSAASRNKWKSDSSINSDTTPEITCIPLKLLRRVRRSLPVAESHSAIQSLEDVARCLYTPVFPECVYQPIKPGVARSPSLGSSTSGGRRSKGLAQGPAIPKVEITLTSKDDNYFYENPSPFSKQSKLRKYISNSATTE